MEFLIETIFSALFLHLVLKEIFVTKFVGQVCVGQVCMGQVHVVQICVGQIWEGQLWMGQVWVNCSLFLVPCFLSAGYPSMSQTGLTL